MSNWKYLECHDRKQRDGSCDICGATIRFEHILEDEHGWKMRIGCECADKCLSGMDIEEIRKFDRQMKNDSRREAAREKRLHEGMESYNRRAINYGYPTKTYEEYCAWVESNLEKEKAMKERKKKRHGSYKY